jgi:cytochrome c-type biogenesis protein CcmE
MPSRSIADTAPSGGGPARPTAKSRRWFAFAAIAVAAAALIAITAGGIGQNLVYYWGPTEVHAAGDKAIGATIRLGGLVKKGTLVRHPDGSRLEFDVIDRPGAAVRVVTHSVPPQMFREGIGVVVEGTMTDAGHFESRRLMVSHSNEYRAPDDPARADAKDLMKTTQGLKDGEAQQ